MIFYIFSEYVEGNMCVVTLTLTVMMAHQKSMHQGSFKKCKHLLLILKMKVNNLKEQAHRTHAVSKQLACNNNKQQHLDIIEL